MNKKIINEINQIKSMMGLKESEVDEQGFIGTIKKGIDKGKEMINKSDDTNKPLKVEEYEETLISTFTDYTTIELTRQASRQAIQRIADDIARRKGLGKYIKRQVFTLDRDWESTN